MKVSRGQRLLAVTVACALLGATNADDGIEADLDSRDWKGMRRDLYYLVGWQVVATVIVYHAPFEFSNWSEDEKDNLGLEQWGDNVLDPVWDEDHWTLNYVIHPYWGAGYYIRGRERGFSRKESFWIAALYSTVYEFGIESFLEQPSIQDLIVTPIAGTALGMYFEKVRQGIRGKPGPLSFGDKMKLGFTDPLGALNRGANRLVGIQDTEHKNLVLGLQPVRSRIGPVASSSTEVVLPGAREIDGFRLTFVFTW